MLQQIQLAFCKLVSITSGYRLNPAYPGANAAFADQLEDADLRGVRNMNPAAQLKAVITNLNYTDDVAVFLAKECHSTHSFSFVNRLVLNDYVQSAPDLRIYPVLNVDQLFRRNRAEMREVKAQACAFY
ncbi:hypothetical protein D3C75_814460 [compost metagenome]